MTDAELILSRTTDGLEVFEHFFDVTITRKLFTNIYRKDSHPSCRLKYVKKKQRYVLKDYGDSTWYGDCFRVVGMIKNLNPRTHFGEILKIIDNEMSLNCIGSNYDPNYVSTPKVLPSAFENAETKAFTAVSRPFSSDEIAFWGKYGITLSTLEKYHVRSIDTARLEREGKDPYTVYGTKKQPAFGYMFDKGRGMKVYRPLSENRFLYAGVLPKPYIFGLEQLPERGDLLLITGGEKDVMSLAAHGFHAICFNSETSRIYENVIRPLSERFSSVIFLYDSDATGIRESSSRVVDCVGFGLDNVLSVTLPLAGTKQEKDVSDFFRLGHTRQELLSILNKHISL